MLIDNKTVTYMSESDCKALIKKLNSTDQEWSYLAARVDAGWYVRVYDESSEFLGTL